MRFEDAIDHLVEFVGVFGPVYDDATTFELTAELLQIVGQMGERVAFDG